MVSSCQGGTIKIWSKDKVFLREINFPNKVDSVSFFNSNGDILVSHDQRVSIIKFDKYKTKSFQSFKYFNTQFRMIKVTDEYLEELKAKENDVKNKKKQNTNNSKLIEINEGISLNDYSEYKKLSP